MSLHFSPEYFSFVIANNLSKLTGVLLYIPLDNINSEHQASLAVNVPDEKKIKLRSTTPLTLGRIANIFAKIKKEKGFIGLFAGFASIAWFCANCGYDAAYVPTKLLLEELHFPPDPRLIWVLSSFIATLASFFLTQLWITYYTALFTPNEASGIFGRIWLGIKHSFSLFDGRTLCNLIVACSYSMVQHPSYEYGIRHYNWYYPQYKGYIVLLYTRWLGAFTQCIVFNIMQNYLNNNVSVLRIIVEMIRIQGFRSFLNDFTIKIWIMLLYTIPHVYFYDQIYHPVIAELHNKPLTYNISLASLFKGSGEL